MKSKQAFTIIEALVVIGIIAILTIIIFPAMNNIRAKNRDAEKIADISAIQLGLSLYKNQQDGAYPESLEDLLDKKYITEDSLISPNDDQYIYIPLKKANENKCIYYHLGVELELPSGQIDTTDNFISLKDRISNSYEYCLS